MAGEDLEREHLGWAVGEARQLAVPYRRWPDALPDVEQEALIGFLAACRRFRPDLGVPFRPYASRRMAGQIADYLRRVDHLSRSDRHALDAWRAGPNRDRPPERDDGTLIPGTVSLELVVEDGPALAGVEPDLPDVALRRAVARLPLRERLVLFLHYWIGLDGTEIADVLGCSPTTVTLERAAAERRLGRLLDLAA